MNLPMTTSSTERAVAGHTMAANRGGSSSGRAAATIHRRNHHMTSSTMRTLIHDRFGDPAEVLHVEERPLPEPGPGQVRVRTLLSAIHNHDLWTVRGTYGFKPE